MGRLDLFDEDVEQELNDQYWQDPENIEMEQQLLSMNYYERPTHNECLVNGQRRKYDGCSSNEDLKESKRFYHGWYYIGSGYTTWHNGTENNWGELHHFFVKEDENSRFVLVEKSKRDY